MIPGPKSMLGGEGGGGGLWLRFVGAGAVWDGSGTGRVDSTGPGGVKAGDDRCRVKVGGAKLGEDYSMLDQHKAEDV